MLERRSERSNLAVVMAICDYLDNRLPRKDVAPRSH